MMELSSSRIIAVLDAFERAFKDFLSRAIRTD